MSSRWLRAGIGKAGNQGNTSPSGLRYDELTNKSHHKLGGAWNGYFGSSDRGSFQDQFGLKVTNSADLMFVERNLLEFMMLLGRRVMGEMFQGMQGGYKGLVADGSIGLLTTQARPCTGCLGLWSTAEPTTVARAKGAEATFRWTRSWVSRNDTPQAVSTERRRIQRTQPKVDSLSYSRYPPLQSRRDEMADMPDSKSGGGQPPCRFKSDRRHALLQGCRLAVRLSDAPGTPAHPPDGLNRSRFTAGAGGYPRLPLASPFRFGGFDFCQIACHARTDKSQTSASL